jgi:hypothetical protein
MAKKKEKEWLEEELIVAFNLERINATFPLLEEWLATSTLNLSEQESIAFEEFFQQTSRKIDFWNEETLKMRFISVVLYNFARLYDNQERYEGFFDKTISATVGNIYLQTETDFMLAKGIGEIAESPFFHFQEYKRSRKSPPDPMAQLLEAFLIAQEKNKNGKPLYGAVIVGRSWQFIVMEGKKYGVSTLYDATQQDDLLQIIAILRKFKEILETRLLD